MFVVLLCVVVVFAVFGFLGSVCCLVCGFWVWYMAAGLI